MIKINRKIINHKSQAFLIGEIGLNHNGKISNAFKLIDLAKKSGFDAVKFQTYQTELLVNKYNRSANYQKKVGFNDQYSMLKKFELSFEDFEKINKYCKKKKITFLSTPFDPKSAYFLKKLNICAYKISSGDFNNYHLIDLVKNFKKPMIISTGMTNEIDLKNIINDHKLQKNKVIFLHCISNYPTILKETNLGYFEVFKKIGFIYGFSDHTISDTATLSAVIMGAKVIEKHITLSNKMAGPDHLSSLEAKDFENFINKIRDLEFSLSKKRRSISGSEKKIKKVTERKLFFISDLKKNTIIKSRNLLPMRSSFKSGINAKYYKKTINKRLAKDVKKFDLMKWQLIKK